MHANDLVHDFFIEFFFFFFFFFWGGGGSYRGRSVHLLN